MKKFDTKSIVLTALFSALVLLATMVIKIPSLNGYVNIGDTMILVCAIILGRKHAMLAGAIGSALADILLGYAMYAPFTFVIKGLEGFIAGMLFYQMTKHNILPAWSRVVAAVIPAALWMWAGYFICNNILFGLAAAMSSAVGDGFQAGASIIFGVVLVSALSKANIAARIAVNH